MKKPLIIAHRGASAYAHENTIDAFRVAIEMQADMIELDVHRTADGVLIIYHDNKFKGKLLRNLAAEEVFGAADADGYAIPTLKETVQYLGGKIRLNIELKESGYEDDVVETAMEHFRPENVIFSSSIDSAVRAVKKSFPVVATGLVLGTRPLRGLPRSLFPDERVHNTGVDFLAVDRRLLKYGFLRTARRLHMPVYVWTANNSNVIKMLVADDRVAGIFTDRPDLGLFLREAHKKRSSQ